jgi:general stress protein YciG
MVRWCEGRFMKEALVCGCLSRDAVSQDRGHMAEIGRRGGERVSQDRAYMAEIGRRGGEASAPRTDQSPDTDQLT